MLPCTQMCTHVYCVLCVPLTPVQTCLSTLLVVSTHGLCLLGAGLRVSSQLSPSDLGLSPLPGLCPCLGDTGVSSVGHTALLARPECSSLCRPNWGLDLAWWATGKCQDTSWGRAGPCALPLCIPVFPGTYVTRAEATDADDPETDNAALRYSILEQGGAQVFSIDELTGDIRTVQVGLDREVRPQGAATDAGGRGSQGPPTCLCSPCWPSEPDAGSSLAMGPPPQPCPPQLPPAAAEGTPPCLQTLPGARSTRSAGTPLPLAG